MKIAHIMLFAAFAGQAQAQTLGCTTGRWIIGVSEYGDARGKALVDVRDRCNKYGDPNIIMTVQMNGVDGPGSSIGTKYAYFYGCEDLAIKYPNHPDNKRFDISGRQSITSSGVVLYIEMKSKNAENSEFTAAGCYGVAPH